jgi:phosphoglycolate phosphatase-like HAD superfamily hydrolase
VRSPKTFKAQALFFDVEETLIDCATQMTACWEDTFIKANHKISRDQLHWYSGMDGDKMLQALLPGMSTTTREALLEEHSRTYRRDFLAKASGVEGAHETIVLLYDRATQ